MDFHSTGDWNRTNELLIQSQVQRPATATPAYIKLAKHSVRELNPTCELQKGHERDYAPERVFDNERVSCGNRTRLSELEAQHLCRSAKDTDGSLKREG